MRYDHSRITQTYLDFLQYSYDKDIEGRVPPANNNPPQVGSRKVVGPEYAHQAIILWHDRLLGFASQSFLFRKTPSALAALGLKYLIQEIVDALEISRQLCIRNCIVGIGCMYGMGRTKSASQVARRSTGMKMARNTRLSTRKPFAARD